jgi:hypothetical protein
VKEDRRVYGPKTLADSVTDRAPKVSFRPFAALQDRPNERAVSAGKRTEPERDGCAAAVIRSGEVCFEADKIRGRSEPLPAFLIFDRDELATVALTASS